MANLSVELWNDYLNNYSGQEEDFLRSLQDGEFFSASNVNKIGEAAGASTQRTFNASDRMLRKYGTALTEDQRSFLDEGRDRLMSANVNSARNRGRRNLFALESGALEAVNRVGNQSASNIIGNEASIQQLEYGRDQAGRQKKYGLLGNIASVGLSLAGAFL